MATLKVTSLLAAGACAVALAGTAGARGKTAQVQRVTVTVDGSGYHPALVSVRAGRPVRLTFVSKAYGCANDIVVPRLGKKFSLKPGQKKEVVFTPRKGQTIAFACSMNMFQGKAVAK